MTVRNERGNLGKKKSQKPSSMTGVSLAGGLPARQTLWSPRRRGRGADREEVPGSQPKAVQSPERAVVLKLWEARVVPGGVTPSVVFLEEGLIRRDFTDKG